MDVGIERYVQQCTSVGIDPCKLFQKCKRFNLKDSACGLSDLSELFWGGFADLILEIWFPCGYLWCFYMFLLFFNMLLGCFSYFLFCFLAFLLPFSSLPLKTDRSGGGTLWRRGSGLRWPGALREARRWGANEARNQPNAWGGLG